MDHRAALLELARAVDPRQAVSVPAGWLLEALEAVQTSARAAVPQDLTVADLCARFGRKASAVRAWLERGDFAGAYKLKGRDWRVPPAAVEAFLARQASGEPQGGREPAPGDLGAWRRHRGQQAS